ncbi:M16 family metallopeptidase [Cognataquiflexum rubidum]|uniref:M16 family metallopeptidase n=1 Tax=Cognataquiflexum rubidum TaxID=2922273 RepID=UPI001F13932F|nr:pitrilysin family protein [Cognataquiflexum rubidum]MCH6232310.1 insulinase family protein [Cognataquiflexum rubidum]
MKNIILYLFLSLFATSAISQVDRTVIPGPGPAPEIKFGNAESFTLKNGLKVFVIQNNKLPRVSYSLILNRDPILEGDKAGMLNFVGEMMTAGTTNLSKDEFNGEVDFLGASISASATSIYASTLVRNQERVLELMADVLFNPLFPEEELAKLKTQTKSGLAYAKDDPNSISGYLSSKLVFGTDHPYGEFETEATVDNITVEDIKKYYQTYFKPNIAYLAIVGDVDLGEAEKLVNKYFAKWESGAIPSFKYPMPKAPLKNTIAMVDRSSSQQSVINITYPLENSLASQDYLSSRLVGFVLGGGTSSRLFMNLREDKKFTYGANADIGADRLVATFSAGASVRGSATDSAVQEIIYEIRNLREKGINSEELESAKANLSGSFARSLENPATIANFAINMERYNLPKDFYLTYLQRLNALSVEEVNAAAKRLLRPDNLYITVVGNAAEIEKGLLALGEVKRFTNMGDPEKQIVMSAEMTADQVIKNYISAIGGESNARAIKTSKMESVAEIQGMKLNFVAVYDEPKGAFAQRVMMMGNVASNTVIKDGKGSVSAMGQSNQLTDEQYEAAKMSMYIFPELHYEELGYSLVLEGIKDVEGENAYKVIVSNPTGSKQINYYSVETGLKIKTESAEAGDMFYSGYEEVKGVKYPMMMLLKSPMIPMPLETKIEKIEFNVSISEDDMK